jgi:hypothetical protein
MAAYLPAAVQAVVLGATSGGLSLCLSASLPRGESPEQHPVRRLAHDNVFLAIQRHQYPFEAVRQGLRQVVQFCFDKTVADAHRLAQPLPGASMPHIQTLQANETEH